MIARHSTTTGGQFCLLIKTLDRLSLRSQSRTNQSERMRTYAKNVTLQKKNAGSGLGLKYKCILRGVTV